MTDEAGRIVCHFSCGATSAVAAKLALAQFSDREVVIVNAYIVEEHPDNRRFLSDCERWFGRQIVVLRDQKHGCSVDEVWRQRQYMKGPKGAPCSGALKQVPLRAFSKPGDEDVLGFDAAEKHRLDDLRERAPDRTIHAPLIERGLSKEDCLAIIERAGIALPAMYALGFANANCIGCPKGGEGYWNHVRRVFPDVFQARLERQESIGPGAYFFRNRKTGVRFGLKDLDPAAGRHNEPAPACSFFCEAAEREIA